MIHCIRVLSMVNELHKAGYQRIRISPGLSASGMSWRCAITAAKNIEPDGFGILLRDEEPGTVARYNTGQEARYFGWKGLEDFNPRELAMRFLKEYPLIAKGGIGRDWAYAGWLTEIIGIAEQGGRDDILVLYSDYGSDESFLKHWAPPPPIIV